MNPPDGPRERASLAVRTLTVCCTVLGVVAAAEFLLHTQFALLSTLGAAMLAIALDRVVQALVLRRLRRGLAIAVVLVGLFGLLLALGFLLVPSAVAQARALAVQAPLLWQRLQQTRLFISIDQRFDLNGQLRQSMDKVAGAVAPLLAAIGGMLSAVGALLTLTMLTILTLIFGPGLAAAALALLDDRRRALTERVAANIFRSVSGYVGGLLAICSIRIALTMTFLAVTRTPFFLPLAIWSGLWSLVPYAGPLIAAVSITLVAWAAGGISKGVATAIFFMVYGFIEGNVLNPMVFAKTVHVNPLITTLAVLFLAELLGLPGALIAVPLAAAAQIICSELLALRAASGARGP